MAFWQFHVPLHQAWNDGIMATNKFFWLQDKKCEFVFTGFFFAEIENVIVPNDIQKKNCQIIYSYIITFMWGIFTESEQFNHQSYISYGWLCVWISYD